MTIKYYPEVEQGSDEWLQIRCGRLTASEMKLLITPTLKTAKNAEQRTHLYELAAQRVTGYVEPHYVSDDMLRGHEDEIEARIAYSKKFSPVKEMGFITNSKWGFTIGYSPDGLVGDDGLIECKSRRQKYQFSTIVNDAVPDEYIIQIQTGLLVSERKWCDFISYCGGLHMVPITVYPDPQIQEAIIEAATEFERALEEKIAIYKERIRTNNRLIPTQRRIEQEMFI